MPATKKRTSHGCWQREFAVGDRYRCKLLVDTRATGTPSTVRMEWEPHAPRALSKFEIAEYLLGRDRALAEFARESGYTVGVVSV